MIQNLNITCVMEVLPEYVYHNYILCFAGGFVIGMGLMLLFIIWLLN